MAFIDVLGIASILPFIAVLSNPSLIETNIILNTMFKISSKYGLETNQEFLILLGALIFVILIISIAFKSFTTYVQIDPRYFRPSEVETLVGDASKAKKKLNWSPKVSFEELVKEMVDKDVELAKSETLDNL